MERDFRYLRDQHGEAGAREIFEKICTDLFQSWFGSDAHNIRVSQGDEGIDVLVGDFTKPIAVLLPIFKKSQISSISYITILPLPIIFYKSVR